jgi:uracil-DNA glycosylase
MKSSWQNIINNYPGDINSILETVNKKRESLKDNLDIYPSNENIFKCFNFCEFNEIKVVIIGQDPYHGPNQATGLCFAINHKTKIPPSLRNIINELKNNLDIELTDLTLEKWAKQGILLMNAAFTVIQGLPSSQIALWSKFTDYIISQLNTREKIIFVAWRAFAYNKFKNINTERNYIICSSHPSPLSCFKPFKEFPAFKDSKSFSKINTKLLEWNKSPINW